MLINSKKITSVLCATSWERRKCVLLGPSRLSYDVPHTSSVRVNQSAPDDLEDDWSETTSLDDDSDSMDPFLNFRSSDDNVLLKEELIDSEFVDPSFEVACRHRLRPGCNPEWSFVCPDSGATVDMFWDRTLFLNSE